MTTPPNRTNTAAPRRLLAVGCALIISAAPLAGQTAPSGTDTATLAKYDTNHNGVLDPAERAAADADQRAAASAVQTAAPGEHHEDIVTLSPFEVVSDTKGYYSANTMSGTRFNSKLEDMPAPITVVTKQQMADFSMLDINDIFQYTTGTEGTNTYTDFSVNRNGDVTDNVQASPTTANRIRGLSSANTSFNNFEMSGRMPVDPSITDGVEISRGPNANVFGLGQPGGTVNEIALMPLLTKNSDELGLRGDSYDGYRASLDVNRVLQTGKLAVRGSVVFQHDGFVRKPSGVDTERYNASIKWRPFKNTTLSAGAYYFHQYGTRANFVNPRDSVSYWRSVGSPTWDPINEVVHVNGQTLGPFTNDNSLPDGLQRSFTGNGHSYMYVDQTGGAYFTAPTTFGLSKGSITPLQGGQSVRLMASNSAEGAKLGKIGAQPLFTTTPSVSDQKLYDWTKVNLAAVNYDWDTDLMSTAQLDQIFFSTPRQQLAGQLAVFQEDAHRFRRDFFGVSNDNGQSGQLLIDVNERNLDGTPNPYLGRLYIGQDQPRTYYQPLKWDSYRAQLAYKLDLTHENGFLKWLGKHTISAYDEYKYRIQRRYSYREAILNDLPWLAGIQSRGNQGNVSKGPFAAPQTTRAYFRFYVSDPNSTGIDYAPTPFQGGAYTLNWGTYTLANQSVNGKNYLLAVPGSGVFNQDQTQFGLAAVTDSTGAGSNTKTILKTAGAVIQSHFLDDRLVTTFGRREDKQYTKNGSSPQQLIYPGGIAFNYDSINHWEGGDYAYNAGITTQAGAVLRPFHNLGFVNSMKQSSGAGHFLGGLLDGLFLTYNKSNSFLPEDPKIDLYFNPLPNTTANDKEFGAGVNLFDGQLVIRWDRYHTTVNNFRGGDASTIAQRVTRIDLTSSARFLLYNQMSSRTPTPVATGTPVDPGWIVAGNPDISDDALHAEVAKEMGLPWDTITKIQDAFNDGSIASTQDQIAVGNEVEINYVSPSRNFTMIANISQQKAINTNVSDEIQQWISERMPIWTTIKDPRDGSLWWTHNYGGSQTAAQNFDSFVRVPYSVVKAQEGKSNPDVREYHVNVLGKYSLRGITDNRILKNIDIGGAVRWEDKGAIGYYGIADANGIYTDLDANAPIWDKAHFYVDFISSYRTRLWGNRIGATFRFTIQNIQEGGRIQPIAAYPDGTTNTYRIVDPRKFILSATFDF